jgi:hypothetical protein
MLNKKIAGVLFAGFLTFSAFGQEVVVKVAPPRAIVETRGVAPGKEYIWVAGYHRWDGRAYVWVPGRWDRPPHPHAHWVAHRWVKRHGGYVLVEGHWK